MLSSTYDLFKRHGGLIAVCFSLMFFSVFGQSVFFGLYMPEIQQALDLSNTAVGSLYGAATILSSVLVVFTSKWLDIWPLRHFVAFTLTGLAVGCFAMAGSYTLAGLFAAFLLLRHFGQGLMSISSNATINRYLDKNRGKATALTGLGGPVHLMVFPFIVHALGMVVEWRTAWLYYGIFILTVLLPAFWWFLKTHQQTTHARWTAELKQSESNPNATALRHWTAKEVLKDWRIYALIAISSLSPFAGTVVFFYQAELAQSLGLTEVAFATSFPFLTIGMIASALVAGSILDVYGEKPALVSYPIVYSLGIFCLTFDGGIGFLYLGMGLIGIGGGIMAASGGPILAQFYGTKYLSSVKSLMFSSAIVASAASPFLFGLLIDKGIDIQRIFAGVLFYSGTVWLLAFPLCRKEQKI